ncbi:hypothetical protein [Novosphingobium huizhouense]|nr:hypothetical protein [Novosphingobium huizhouense]
MTIALLLLACALFLAVPFALSRHEHLRTRHHDHLIQGHPRSAARAR